MNCFNQTLFVLSIILSIFTFSIQFKFSDLKKQTFIVLIKNTPKILQTLINFIITFSSFILIVLISNKQTEFTNVFDTVLQLFSIVSVAKT